MDQSIDLWSRMAPTVPTGTPPTAPTGTMESDLLLAAIVASMTVLGIALFRFPRQPLSEALIETLRNRRDVVLLFGLCSIGLGLGELYSGFHAGRLEYVRRFRPTVWISYGDHAVFFGVLGALYSGMAIFGLFAVKVVFRPEISVAPLIKHARLLGLVWLAVIGFAIYAFVFLR